MEELLDHLLVVWEQPGMVLGHAAAQKSRVDHAPKERLLIVIGERLQPLRHNTIDRLLLCRGGQVELVI